MPPSRLVLIVVIGLLLIFIAAAPGLIARRRRHPNAQAIGLCGFVGLFGTFGILWTIALVWAHTGPDGSKQLKPGTFRLTGADRASGMETSLVVEASSEAVARAMGEARGIVVATVERAKPGKPSKAAAASQEIPPQFTGDRRTWLVTGLKNGRSVQTRIFDATEEEAREAATRRGLSSIMAVEPG